MEHPNGQWGAFRVGLDTFQGCRPEIGREAATMLPPELNQQKEGIAVLSTLGANDNLTIKQTVQW